MREPENIKSISELQEDELEKYLENITIGQATENHIKTGISYIHKNGEIFVVI